MQLDGKIALVTGGSRGIGRACVVELARRGADVTFVYHSNSESAASLVSELTGEGLQVQAEQADVRDGERAQQIVDAIVEKHDRIDVLVNSAGIAWRLIALAA